MTNFPRETSTMNSIKLRWLCFCVAALLLQTAAAGDAYYNLPVSALTLTEGTLPANEAVENWRRWRMMSAIQPYAALDGEGEAYISGDNNMSRMRSRGESSSQTISIRAPENQAIAGRLFVPKGDMSGLIPVRFKISPTEAKPEAKAAFLTAKEQFYRGLLNRTIAGAAWFRHQLEMIAKERGTNQSPQNNPGMNWNRNRPPEFEDTFNLFTGGRALSENLQLDRAMALRNGTNGGSVALTNLTGITVRQMDWKTLLHEPKPGLDPLASFIPADQHALFFPSFQAMADMTDETDANGTPVLQMFEPRSEDASSRDRYQNQLCLGLSDLPRLLGPQVVASAAFTGSDPFLRVGTDVAVLFEARNLPLLQASVIARQTAARTSHPGARAVSGDIEGVHYVGVVSPDRAVCSYLASVSNVVFVTNSRKQLENLVRTAQGKLPALSSQEEYLFFRQRYVRGDESETAFLVLSDATIRRWCGPQWRIADSRRTRAAAVLAELQAGQVDGLVRGKTGVTNLSSDYSTPDLGELGLAPAGVTSATYGTLNFMTPISEIPLATVTSNEANAYERWREGYQNNWQQFFDPIAVRFSISQQRLSTELTVMPLIMASRYNSFIAFATGAQIAPGAGDPHTNVLARLAFAVNNQSQSVQEAGNFVGNMAPGLKANFLSWLGQSVTLYADADPFWSELAAATNADVFMEHSLGRLPVGLYCEVKNSLGVAAFLTAVHAYADQSAPQMTVWKNLEYAGRPYVKIVPSKTSLESEPDENWTVYYAVTPDSLTVTLSEDLLKRALDRQIARSNTNAPAVSGVKSWLGRSLGLQVDRKFIDVLIKAMQDDYQAHLQMLAWNNLPILNEWKRLYPDKDPVKLHEQLWGVKLLCPGGGTYVWNDRWHTMESTVFGHPGEPKSGTASLFPGMTDANLGITFEDQGLSAKGIMNRKAVQ